MFEDTFFGEVMTPIIVIILVMFGLFFAISYISSIKESEIYNRINGTSYSASDFMWAGDQINSQSKTIKITK